MWSLRERKDGSIYLTYDRDRRGTLQLRGLWEFIGWQSNEYVKYAVMVNESAGHLCCPDDEGAMRVLVLTD
jgi:hypothetical protein